MSLSRRPLRAEDLPGREDLTPWLAGVYVDPAYRGRGVASALGRHVVVAAGKLGFGKLYLFTDGQAALYHRLGWRVIGDAVWQGHEVSVMGKELAAYSEIEAAR